MEKVNFVNQAVFYVKEGKAVVSFDLNEARILADQAFYDGADTLVLFGVDGVLYVVQNIVPEIRVLLNRQTEVMVILQQNDGVAAAYELALPRDADIQFEDNFARQAAALCEELGNSASV